MKARDLVVGQWYAWQSALSNMTHMVQCVAYCTLEGWGSRRVFQPDEEVPCHAR